MDFFIILIFNQTIKLLDRNPQNRLGAKDDGNCIRNHPWLRDINW